MNNIEVKENSKSKKKKKRKLNIQKIFNLLSFVFIIACCIFYGRRFIKLYLENNQEGETKLFAQHIRDDNQNNDFIKEINGVYYFIGENPNNYIQYSNLIWRIIKINSDNTITIVLENPITALAAGTINNYEKSYINMWLNNQNENYTGILENNLNNTNKYLAHTKTCYDIINDTKNITCKKTIANTLITVPSLNDYVNTGGHEGFLNSGHYYYLTNMTKENKIWYIDENGKVGISDGTDIIGIKPVITIKKNIKLINGNGTIDNPYKIETERSLFGSYVKLDNDIWRIYQIDEENIKLSLNSHLVLNGNEVKYKYSTNGYYHNDTKENSLAYYLNNTYINTLNYSDIINEAKYSNGTYSNATKFNYIDVLKKQVDTKITTLSIGDIILNSENSNYFSTTGVSEDENQIYVIRNNFEIYTKNSTSNLNIVPVITIKKDLLNIGDGTIDNPWEVSHE